MFDKKISNKIKIIIVLLVGVAVLIFLIFVANKFLLNSISFKKDELEKQKLSLEYFINEGKKLEKYEHLTERMEQSQKAIDEAIVTRGDEIKFIKNLESISSSLNMKIDIKTYKPPKKKAVVDVSTEGELTPEKELELQRLQARQQRAAKLNYFMVNYVGDYPSLMNFIYKIENSGHAIILESLEIKTLSVMDIQRMKAQSQTQPQAEKEGYSGTKIEANILLSFMPL